MDCSPDPYCKSFLLSEGFQSLPEFLTVSEKDPPFCFSFSIVYRDYFSCAHRCCSRGGFFIEIDDVPVSLRKNQQPNFSVEVF